MPALIQARFPYPRRRYPAATEHSLITDLTAQFQDYLAGERGAADATVAACTQTLHRLLEFLEQLGHAPHFEDLTTPLLRRFVASLSR